MDRQSGNCTRVLKGQRMDGESRINLHVVGVPEIPSSTYWRQSEILFVQRVLN